MNKDQLRERESKEAIKQEVKLIGDAEKKYRELKMKQSPINPAEEKDHDKIRNDLIEYMKKNIKELVKDGANIGDIFYENTPNHQFAREYAEEYKKSRLDTKAKNPSSEVKEGKENSQSTKGDDLLNKEQTDEIVNKIIESEPKEKEPVSWDFGDKQTEEKHTDKEIKNNNGETPKRKEEIFDPVFNKEDADKIADGIIKNESKRVAWDFGDKKKEELNKNNRGEDTKSVEIPKEEPKPEENTDEKEKGAEDEKPVFIEVQLAVEKESKPERKFDTKKIAEEINEKIAEEEKASGVPLTLEQEQKLFLEMFLKEKENFNKETIESSGKFKGTLLKTEEWWQNLEKTRSGKITKAAMSAAFIGSATLLAGMGLGIAPPPFGIAKRLLTRVAMATGLNMALTSNITGNFFSKLKKEQGGEKEEEEEKSKWKKIFSLGNIASVGGIGTAFILSGGTVAAFAALGVVSRKITNSYFDLKIKEGEKEIKRLSEEVKIESTNDSFDINELAKKLEEFGKNYDDIEKSLKKFKWGKSITNGTLTMLVGVGTMATLSHDQVEAGVKTKNDLESKHQTGLKHPEEIKTHVENKSQTEIKEEELQHPVGFKQQEELKVKIIEQMKLEDEIVHKGEGIEHTFIRQIENNHDLAKELGFKGDINDAKALHEFAGREAHFIARETGYVDDAGHEVRVAEADKVAYEIKMKNGHITIDEKTVGGEIFETHHEGDKFEEKADKHEINYTKPHEIDDASQIKENINNPIETNREEKIINEYEDTSIPTREESVSPLNDYKDEFWNNSSENQNKSEIRDEYEDTSKPVIKEYEDNPLNLPDEVWEQVNQTYQNNIENVSPKDPNIFKHIQLNAEETIKEDLNTVNETYKPSISYIQELERVTDIHPRNTTIFQSAETNAEYIRRVLETEAAKGNLLKATVDSTGITHIDKVKF